MISVNTGDGTPNITPGRPSVPNGTAIPIIPGVLIVHYDSSTTADSGSVQVSVELFGNTVDTLDGSCSWKPLSASLSDQFDIKVLGFDLFGGSFSLSADEIGLKAGGDLDWLGNKVDLGSGYLVRWP